MNLDQIGHNLRALYLHNDNGYQPWAWVLTIFALLFLIKGTRRLGGVGFLVAVGCMIVFFSVNGMMKDMSPTSPDVDMMNRAKHH